MQNIEIMQHTPRSCQSSLYSSQPNLHIDQQDQEVIKNVNVRKRKNPACDEISDLKESLMTAFKDLFTAEIAQVKEQNAQIMQSNSEMLDILQANTDSFKQLNDKMLILENKYATAMERIDELELQLNDLQKHRIKNTVEIRNIPKQDKESPQAIVNLLYDYLKLPYTSAISQCYRKGKNNAPIVIEFSNHEEKEKIIKAIKKYNRDNKMDKLNTSHLGFSENATPVYVSEALTTMNKKILTAARSLVKDGHYKYCWTFRGNILIRKNDGDSALVLKSCAQIETLRSA